MDWQDISAGRCFIVRKTLRSNSNENQTAMNPETNPAGEPIHRQRPGFIKPLEKVSGNPTIKIDGNATTTDQSGSLANPQRDNTIAPGFGKGSAGGGKPPDGAERGITNRSENRGSSDSSGLGLLPRLDPVALADGLIAVAPEDTFEGQEHQVFRDASSGVAVKLTQPAAFGARGSLSGYLTQMKVINELFGDQVTVDGTVQFPGETGSRLVSTQPWVHGDESSLEEIGVYMRRKGFVRLFDGAWWNPSTELQVTDALPKNFRTDCLRRVHPIDLIVAWPSARAQERLEDMVNAQPQPDPLPEPAALQAKSPT